MLEQPSAYSTYSTYLEDIVFSPVLVVRRHCGLQQAEDEGGAGAIILGPHVRVEQQLVALKTHVMLEPTLVLNSGRKVRTYRGGE